MYASTDLQLNIRMFDVILVNDVNLNLNSNIIFVINANHNINVEITISYHTYHTVPTANNSNWIVLKIKNCLRIFSLERMHTIEMETDNVGLVVEVLFRFISFGTDIIKQNE